MGVDTVDGHVVGLPRGWASFVLAPLAPTEHGTLHLRGGVPSQMLTNLRVFGMDDWRMGGRIFDHHFFLPCVNFRNAQCFSVLAISYLGAKHDFEIWAFKVFFLWTRKTPLRMASRGSDLNIKIGNNTQEIHHKA